MLFTAAFAQSLLLNTVGMLLYAIFPLALLRRDWKMIGIKKPAYPHYLLYGSFLAAALAVASYIAHYYTVGFSSANLWRLWLSSNSATG